MAQPTDPKLAALRAQHAVHPHPERVRDALFQGDNPFFDPRDVVQVKYEMLRRVDNDGAPVGQTADAFGFTRPIFYQARRAFAQGGLAALQHARPGPRRRHKLKAEILTFLRETRADHPGIGARRLAKEVRDRFGLEIHPRTIERALRAPERERGGHSPQRSTPPP